MHDKSRRPGGNGRGTADDFVAKPGAGTPGRGRVAAPGASGKPGGQTLAGAVPSRPALATEVPHRREMEAAFGADFSSVKASTGQDTAMAKIGASAAARGEAVAFADATPSKAVVAHELTHVVQQRQSGVADAAAKKATIAPVESAAEKEADRVADRVARGEPAGAITAPPAGAIHRFAPDRHRAATVSGLASTFSAQEIGEIYASNWERDFSQGHPDIASSAIAWTGVKNHAATHHGDPGPAAETFRAAVWKVVNGSILEAGTESLGSYQPWEHVDAPLDPEVRDRADARWAKQANGVAGYIMDSKAYIKDQIVAAVEVYRLDNNLDGAGRKIDNWGTAGKPDGYTAPAVGVSDRGHARGGLPANFDDAKVASRDPIREETAREATTAGAAADAAPAAGPWRLIGQHLGRAMHSFEDFWAHSNWLELAKAARARAAKGGKVVADGAANRNLKTGTFGRAAQAHALGHKLLALSAGFQRDFDLLLKIYGRDKASTKIDDPSAKALRQDRDGAIERSDNERAYGRLKADAWTSTGEILDVGMGVSDVEQLILGGQYKMDDFLCNRSWLEALAGKGQILIKQGDADSGADSHGKIAKDADEGDPDKDHAGAMVLARRANALVFAPLRAIMDQPDVAAANAALVTQLALVDRLLVAPAPGHPLWDLVEDG